MRTTQTCSTDLLEAEVNAIGTVTRRHTPDQALPERIGILHASEHGLDHGKFVATEARQRVVRTQARAQSFCYGRNVISPVRWKRHARGLVWGGDRSDLMRPAMRCRTLCRGRSGRPACCCRSAISG